MAYDKNKEDKKKSQLKKKAAQKRAGNKGGGRTARAPKTIASFKPSRRGSAPSPTKTRRSGGK